MRSHQMRVLGAGEARMTRVMFVVGLGELFGVSSIQAASRDGPAAPSSPTSISIAKEYCCPPIYLSWAYLNVWDCVTHMWPIPMVCNSIPCDIPEHDPPRTYVHMYLVRINPGFRASSCARQLLIGQKTNSNQDSGLAVCTFWSSLLWQDVYPFALRFVEAVYTDQSTEALACLLHSCCFSWGHLFAQQVPEEVHTCLPFVIQVIDEATYVYSVVCVLQIVIKCVFWASLIQTPGADQDLGLCSEKDALRLWAPLTPSPLGALAFHVIGTIYSTRPCNIQLGMRLSEYLNNW